MVCTNGGIYNAQNIYGTIFTNEPGQTTNINWNESYPRQNTKHVMWVLPIVSHSYNICEIRFCQTTILVASPILCWMCLINYYFFFLLFKWPKEYGKADAPNYGWSSNWMKWFEVRAGFGSGSKYWYGLAIVLDQRIAHCWLAVLFARRIEYWFGYWLWRWRRSEENCFYSRRWRSMSSTELA